MARATRSAPSPSRAGRRRAGPRRPPRPAVPTPRSARRAARSGAATARGPRSLARALVVGRGAVDHLEVTRRALGFGEQLGGEQRQPPDAVVTTAEGIARATRGLDGRALAGDLHLRHPGEVAAQAR